MPLYEYECRQCGRRTEKIQKFSDAPLTTCPHCGAEALEKTVTAPAFQFAGGGWYKDLYSSAKPAAGTAEAGAKSGGDSKSGEAAPAAPAAANPAPAAPAAAPAASTSASGTSKS